MGASINFKGQTVICADIALHPDVKLMNATFIKCNIDDSLATVGSVMDKCILIKCKIRSES